MPEKYLILGASSFYGRNFSKFVREKGEEVIEVSLRDLNIRDLLEPEPHYIVNFAAANIVAESWDRPEEYAQVNVVETTRVIAELAKHKWLKKYIHVSTPEVYGSTEGWVDETHHYNPTTPYAVTRAAGDMMAMAYFKALKFPVLITRTANIYGLGQEKHRIIPLAFDKIMRREKIPLHGGGNSHRCFVHIQDACAATYRLAREGSVGLTYHISNPHPTSIANLLKRICVIAGVKFDQVTETVPDRPGKDFAYFLKSDRLRNMGWRDKITLDRGLREYADSLAQY